MKFLIKTLGWDRWRDEVLAALEQVRDEGGAGLPFDPDAPPVETRAGLAATDGIVASTPFGALDVARRAARSRRASAA